MWLLLNTFSARGQPPTAKNGVARDITRVQGGKPCPHASWLQENKIGNHMACVVEAIQSLWPQAGLDPVAKTLSLGMRGSIQIGKWRGCSWKEGMDSRLTQTWTRPPPLKRCGRSQITGCMFFM